MKQLFTIIFSVLLPLGIYSQPSYTVAPPLIYDQIFDAEGFTIQELNKYIKSWIVSYQGKGQIKEFTEDSMSKKIVSYGFIPSKRIKEPLSILTKDFNYNAIVEYTMSVEIREGRYRIKFENMVHIDPDAGRILSHNEDGTPSYRADLGFGLLTYDDEVPPIRFPKWIYKRSLIEKYWNDVKEETMNGLESLAQSLRNHIDIAKGDDEW